MAVAQNTVIIDDVEYKPGEQLPELGSIHRVFKDGGKRHYEGLAKDSDKLPLYVANNSSCFMTDTGEYYKFDESKKLWYKPDKIEQSKVTPIEVYGVLNGKIQQVSEDVEGIATPLLYKGSVSDISQLPLSPKIGWMYNISKKSIYGEAGMNVAWTGEIWDALGPAIDMAPYLREDSEIITSLKTKTENLESANYTDRGTLADTDAFLVNDGTGMKKSVLSKLSDFVLNKIADKVFAKLQTNDKTILGAINELNSNSNMTSKTYDGKNYSSQFCRMYVSKNLGTGKPSSIIVFGYEGIGVALFDTMYVTTSNPAPSKAINIYGEIFKIENETILVNLNADRNRQIVIISPQGVEIELEPVE